MNNSYEAFVAYNRQLLVDAAREKNIILTINDLQDISGPQIPLTMMADEFLDALQEELFSVQDITQVYNGFREFFTAHLAERPTTGDLLSDAMPSNGWIIVQAENAMTNLIRQMITPAYLLEEQRITEEDIDEMSYDDLVEAISENRYRQDSSHSYN